MSSIGVALDALDAAVELLGAADLSVLPARERFVAVDRLETLVRRQVAIARAQLTHLERFPGCPPVDIVLADMLRISRRGRRLEAWRAHRYRPPQPGVQAREPARGERRLGHPQATQRPDRMESRRTFSGRSLRPAPPRSSLTWGGMARPSEPTLKRVDS